MTLDQAKADRRDAQLREWYAKLDELQAKADKAAADAKIQCYREMDSLRSNLDSLKKRWSDAQQASGDAWEDMKDGVDKAWHEFKEAFDNATNRF